MITIRRLVWDDWNVAHIARHQVVPAEVEQVCHGDHLVRETHHTRLMLIGPTRRGRMLVIILAPEADDQYYVVTARPADRRERRLYEQEQRGE
ncbi:MAG: BrnT family toxin [Chloroflexi bacterium]|nr:BrnT family toxin [Chloroflexota bacterium]